MICINTVPSCTEETAWTYPLITERDEKFHIEKKNRIFSIVLSFFCVFALPVLRVCTAGRVLTLLHNNPRFQYYVAITNFLVPYTCEIRFHDVRGRSTV